MLHLTNHILSRGLVAQSQWLQNHLSSMVISDLGIFSALTLPMVVWVHLRCSKVTCWYFALPLVFFILELVCVCKKQKWGLIVATLSCVLLPLYCVAISIWVLPVCVQTFHYSDQDVVEETLAVLALTCWIATMFLYEMHCCLGLHILQKIVRLELERAMRLEEDREASGVEQLLQDDQFTVRTRMCSDGALQLTPLPKELRQLVLSYDKEKVIHQVSVIIPDEGYPLKLSSQFTDVETSRKGYIRDYMSFKESKRVLTRATTQGLPVRCPRGLKSLLLQQAS
jgi:hypothetical protein